MQPATGHRGPTHSLRRIWLTALAGVVASWVMARPVCAGYTQLTQTRSLSTGASAESFGVTPQTDADSETSDALGSFSDRSVTSGASAFSQIPNPPFFASGNGTATARQSVSLAPTSITGTLVGDASAGTRVAAASGTATSSWSTTFRVDQPTPFDLRGGLGVQNIAEVMSYTTPSHNAFVSLSRRPDAGGDAQALYDVSVPPFFSSRPVEFSGVLEPGYVYSLTATAGASRTNNSFVVSAQIGGSTVTTVTFTLTTVPEPAGTGVLMLGAALLLRRRRA